MLSADLHNQKTDLFYELFPLKLSEVRFTVVELRFQNTNSPIVADCSAIVAFNVG